MPYAPPTHSTRRTLANRKLQQYEYNKTRTGQQFYKTTAWKKLRLWHLLRNPVCIECREMGQAAPARIVDHIVPIKQGGEALAQDNLQSLCQAHHNRKTAGERIE